MSDLRGRLRRLVRRGPRDVLYAHAATNGGNHLYLWMLAHTLRRANPQTYVQVVPSQAPWVAEFPALAELCLPGRMHVTDRRIARLGAGFDSDFTRSDLTDFTRARLLSSPSFTDRLAAAREVVTPGTLTVNIRRGDYYGTVHEAEFGIRIVPYVAAALALQAARAPLGHVQVVSDDLPWCQANLAPTLDEAGVTSASFTRPGTDMFDDIAALAVSRRLVLANSTFSYWGGYLATVLGTDPADVVAPYFHQRAFGQREPWFHDPAWSYVRDVPGGWQPPAPAPEADAR